MKFSWAPSWGKEDVPSHIKVPADSFDIIRNASSYLKEAEPLDNFDLEGTVVNLNRDSRLNKTETHLRELARRSGYAEASLRQAMQKLKRLDLVSDRRSGNRVYFSANQAHPLKLLWSA